LVTQVLCQLREIFLKSRLKQKYYIFLALFIHSKQLENISDVEDYLNQLNVDFILEVVRESVHWALQCKKNIGEELYKACIRGLEVIRTVCPGLTEPLFQLARIHYFMNDSQAKQLLTHILGK